MYIYVERIFIFTAKQVIQAIILYFVIRLLKVHTAYYTSDGILVTQPLSCAKHYIK